MLRTSKAVEQKYGTWSTYHGTTAQINRRDWAEEVRVKKWVLELVKKVTVPLAGVGLLFSKVVRIGPRWPGGT